VGVSFAAQGVPHRAAYYRLLLDEIDAGRLPAGKKLLQEKQYAARLGVSLAPVRQAILALAKTAI
jgi:DNA-binding GntR family transcriptional regulator